MSRESAVAKTYSVKEIYYTLQGEGAHAGRAAVFCRFAGCNLWSGHEEDRETAVCTFCDTDFVGTNGPGGGKFTSGQHLADAVHHAWHGDTRGQVRRGGRPYVVCTGGEPLLQLDESLIREFAARGFEVAVETNGTQEAPPGLDWICVSPKAASALLLTSGNEIKLVFPQRDAQPGRFEDLAFDHFYLQPMDGPDQEDNIQSATRYCLEHPQWRLSLQSHKLIGIP
jgi:7-carboxy-7-deazaguanine synthase